MERRPGSARRPRRTGRRWVVGIALLLVTAGVAAYLLCQAPVPPPEAVSPVAGHGPAAPPPSETLPPTDPEAVPEAPLPPLAESDALAGELAGALTRHPALAEWLATEGFIRRFVAVVDNIADGESPRPHLGFLVPTEPLRVIARGERVFLDPGSYARYDRAAEVFASLDPEGCADAYRRLQPLLNEAYRDLGRPDRTFEAALRAAIVRLLATPVVADEVELEPRVISYDFADPTLEARSAAEKHLLRMGPGNVRRIREQLRLIATALGMPEAPPVPPAPER